jgi:hypothetical protein
MAKLYFMNREFAGLCLGLDEAIENGEIRLLFEDSWYWLHYQFFNCRDSLCSETSSAVRTHLYNLAAMLYRSFESLSERTFNEISLRAIIEEVVEIAEYSREFSVCLWVHGDKISQCFLHEKLSALPTDGQMQIFLQLPHFLRWETERLPYRFNEEKPALARYRREFAAYNKRIKLAHKEKQREANSERKQ